MQIRVRRSGGFAGISRQATVETAGRPDAAQWHRLAEEALAAGHPAPPRGVPDGYQYALTVGDRTVYFADPELPDTVGELVSRVLRRPSGS